MGKAKTNSKAAEKKRERLEMEKKMNARVAIVKAANNTDDPLENLPSFKKYEKNDIQVEISAERLIDLDASAKKWLMELITKNMKDLYEKSDWGWKESTKREEMFDDRAWYLFARSTALEDAGKLLAFSHFRFDMDYDDEVLYVYEIQLEDCAKRKGLGKFMMQVLEIMAFKADMRKIMVTCFKHNPAAQKFFKGALKYEIDETCQTDDVYEQFDYEILSKMNKRKLAREAIETLELSKKTSSASSKSLATVQIQGSNVSIKNDCRSPLKDANSETAKNTSHEKTMFPMTFGYEEAKSPRSPLGTINLNANFKASPSSMSKDKAAGDFKAETMLQKSSVVPGPLNFNGIGIENKIGDTKSDELDPTGLYEGRAT